MAKLNFSRENNRKEPNRLARQYICNGSLREMKNSELKEYLNIFPDDADVSYISKKEIDSQTLKTNL